MIFGFGEVLRVLVIGVRRGVSVWFVRGLVSLVLLGFGLFVGVSG